MSLVAATVTARLLGPAGKGFYSSLLLIVGIFVQVFGAGLAEAAVVLVGQRRLSLRAAFSGTVGAVLPLSALAVAAFVVVARVVLHPATAADRLAVVFAAVLVAVMMYYTATTWFLVAQERVVASAVLAGVQATVTTGSLCILLIWGDLRSEGAILGGVAGAVTALVGGALLLARTKLLTRPAWVPGFLGAASRLGARLQTSDLLISLTSRLDLVLVYRLRDAATAGSYSVALTIGTLVAAVPVAVSYASFPRLTRLSEDAARALTSQLFRVGTAASSIGAALLALATPVIIPLAFGDSYRNAVAPTLFLIPAGVLWSAQYLLCRAAAARGDPNPLFISFLVNFVTMLTVDLVLIRPLGAVGAALATLAASATGLLAAALFFRASGWRAAPFIPRRADFAALLSAPLHLLQSWRGRPAR